MADPDVPKGVQRLIAECIDSVAHLEVLLLVRAAPEKRWTSEEVARALVTRPEHAGSMLAHLAGHRLLRIEDDTYLYAPEPAQARDVDVLAESYATRRPTVIELIFAPRDDVRNRSRTAPSRRSASGSPPSPP